MSADIPIENKYGSTPDILKNLFQEYLAFINHKKASVIANCRLVRLKMKWRTENNSIDCGIFVMRHMESYMGQAVSRWDCGFDLESSTQKTQLTRLRYKYASKILLSDLNLHRDKMRSLALEFDGIDSVAQREILGRSLATFKDRVAHFLR